MVIHVMPYAVQSFPDKDQAVATVALRSSVQHFAALWT